MSLNKSELVELFESFGISFEGGFKLNKMMEYIRSEGVEPELLLEYKMLNHIKNVRANIIKSVITGDFNSHINYDKKIIDLRRTYNRQKLLRELLKDKNMSLIY